MFLGMFNRATDIYICQFIINVVLRVLHFYIGMERLISRSRCQARCHSESGVATVSKATTVRNYQFPALQQVGKTSILDFIVMRKEYFINTSTYMYVHI